ncbi:hypothetical protein Tsubulata_049744 [Turnera subulata]|uniref:3-hydroxyisobutyryl-coenzyme A hydrolase n=1 Tax=Turnera subulata TaxID=218843 RepID=A0A9Q0G6Y7_9ROSI|nr:hypothetical protein Tsubulata_049744 [Turnera subulata]
MLQPAAKNAIGKEMLGGLRHVFETIHRDASARVVMVSSSVPKVFCAGADLKERKTMSPHEVQSSVNTLRSTFSFIELSDFGKLNPYNTYSKCYNQYQSTRTLILETATSQSVRLKRLADTDSDQQLETLLGKEMLGGLRHVFETIHRDASARVVMVSSSVPKVFCAGADLKERKTMSPHEVQSFVNSLRSTLSFIEELIFTGRKIGGREAMSIGLANYCVPAGKAQLKALEIAREINQKGPIAIRMAKKAIDEGDEVDLITALELEEECYEQILNTKDRLEGLAAFAEKRKPRYCEE